jgi:hypothetical protein
VSELYEVLSWLIYTLAAVMMLAVIVAAILAGLALRLIAEFLRELGDGREIRDKSRVSRSVPLSTRPSRP